MTCVRSIATPRPGCRDAGRAAFTLVELLVVAAIMAMLFTMVVVGTRPDLEGEIRRSSQLLASVFLAAQSRALGNPAGAAVVIESGGTTSAMVFNGEVPPFLLGTVASGIPPGDPAATSASVTVTPMNGGDINRGFRIQFFGQNPSQPPSAWFGFQSPGTVRFRTEDLQTNANMAWPAPAAGPRQARIACLPGKGDTALALPATVVIDLRYSGTGDDPATTWGNLANKQDIGVLFNAVGSVDALMQGLGAAAGTPPTVRQPVEPVFLLVAARVDATANQALASERSRWVVIQPSTGRVTVSPNVPQAGFDLAAVRAARAEARSALTFGK